MICVIDYGMGNLRSVSKALEHLGAEVCVSDKADDIRNADKIVLPGVGAFGKAMTELNQRNLTGLIKSQIADGKPFLGICLGLQLLFSSSDESPGVEGLGLIKGTVSRFKASGDVKVPHMGWNTIKINDSKILKGIPDESYFYFVHTFFAGVDDEQVSVGVGHYGSQDFCAVLERDNLFATQFHPEKSQDRGLTILKNFITL